MEEMKKQYLRERSTAGAKEIHDTNLKNYLIKTGHAMADGIRRSKASYCEYLDLQSRFSKYSPLNTLLILYQKPNVIKLKDGNEWFKDGAEVKRQASGIHIISPVKMMENDKDFRISYTPKRVFDITETNSNRYPYRPDYKVEDCMKYLVKTSKYRVMDGKNLPSGKNAYFDEGTETVYVDRGSKDMVKSFYDLAYEIALSEIYCANKSSYNRENAAFYAEAVAYMLGKHFEVSPEMNISELPDIHKKSRARDFVRELNRIKNIYRDKEKYISQQLYEHKETIPAENLEKEII